MSAATTERARDDHGGLSRDVARIGPALIRLRRQIHRNPELSFAEVRTAAKIATRVGRMGLRVATGYGGTGVVAEIDGSRPGPTIMVRAELDALPLEEIPGREHGSRKRGVMHACGHDAHMSSLVGVAALLAARRDRLAGQVRLVWQPGEERLSGATRMVADGVLDGVDEVIGAHVFSFMPFGAVAATSGPFLAGADLFQIIVSGRPGHAGMPQASVDPVVGAAAVVTALQTVVSREITPGTTAVVSVASMHGGSAPNVLPERVVLTGTTRWFDGRTRDSLLVSIKRILSGVAATYRVECTFELLATAPVTENAEPLASDALAVAVAAGATVTEIGRVTGSDDFGLYAQERPGVFLGVGCATGEAAPHHAGHFDLDERVIPFMAELLTRIVLRRTRSEI